MARAVLEQRARLKARIDALPAPKRALLKTRHHGDYHLGQVLLANNDFYIIDFEGEPGRPLAESRRKHCALRDVAGMLRSFSYAKWSAAMNAPDKDKDKIKERETALVSWEGETRRAFLEAYGVGEDERGLLELFELEKVLYELRYELNNRPTWVHIPLQGLLGMLERA
jgi:maltose alpha-D-glucosyltransferase / alpha-amylase